MTTATVVSIQSRHARSVRPPGPPVAESYLKVFDFESAVLLTLPCWHFRLFMVLLTFCDFRTGVGRATFEALAYGMTPIQPRTGPKHYTPDVQALKKAVRGFQERGLMSRDKRRSEHDRTLHYLVQPRGLPFAHAPNSNP